MLADLKDSKEAFEYAISFSLKSLKTCSKGIWSNQSEIRSKCILPDVCLACIRREEKPLENESSCHLKSHSGLSIKGMRSHAHVYSHA